MALTAYTYSISEDFPNGKVNPSTLAEQIEASSIVIALDHIETNGDDCDIWFKAALDQADQTTLNGIVAAHSGEEAVDHEPVTIHGFQDLTGYNLFRKGYNFTAVKDTLTNFDAKYTADMMLQGMVFHVDDNAVVGDNIDVQIVDVDGLYSPAGTVWVTFAENLPCWPGRELNCICSDAKKLYAGLYIRFAYDSVGTENNVAVCLEHVMRTIPDA